MKNLLTFLAVILCSVGAFGQGAQYRPTPYANGFVQTVTSTGTAQTYLGIGSSTNNALLNGTNVFTGTNTHAGVNVATNASNSLAGNFVTPPTIGGFVFPFTRAVWESDNPITLTNISYSVTTSNGQQTNINNATYITNIVVPPFASKDGVLSLQTYVTRSSQSVSAGIIGVYDASSNLVCVLANNAGSLATNAPFANGVILQGWNSYTLQFVATNSNWPNLNEPRAVKQWVDGTITNTFHLAMWQNALGETVTNATFLKMRALETVNYNR